jgi:hypothetical protein
MPNQIRRAVGVAMILSPLLALVSAFASPALRASASGKLAEIAQHSDRWYLYALLGTVSMWLFVPAVVGLTSMVSARAARLSLVGGGLALLGALVATGDATTELMYWQMGAPGADRAQMAALAERYEHAAGSSLVFAVGGLALIIGLLLLGVALRRLRLAPAWAALGVPVGVIVNIVGFSSNSNALVIASNVVLLAALGRIGLLWLWPDQAGRPQPVLKPEGALS